MIIIESVSQDIAEWVCRKITADLPEYFGLPEANEQYAIGVRARHNIAAKIGDDYLGLISIDFPYPNNSNIYWMAVLRQYHKQGIGCKLLEAACKLARENHAKTMTVETLALSESDKNYLKTYNFYLSNGFSPLINVKPQGYQWNMVYMFKCLEITDLN